jgi:tannase
VYGAAAGCTDGGMGWGSQLNDIVLKANGSLDYDLVNNFGYLSIHEMTELGKAMSKNIYNSSKLYSYYQGCSEGGREGWSQVQRYADQFDGAAIGAPAFRQSHQQPNHDWPQIYEQSIDYAPNSCALEKIVNETLAACAVCIGIRRVPSVKPTPALLPLHSIRSLEEQAPSLRLQMALSTNKT